MKKRITQLFSILIVSLLFSSLVLAQEMEDAKIMPPEYQGGIGQNEYYTVVFDGEGEAAVAAKLSLQNTQKENLTEFEFEIDGTSIRIINMVQEVLETQKVCSYWEDICNNWENGKCISYERKCQQWYDQQIYPPKYYTIEPKIEKLSESIKINFKLPREIESQQTATIIMYYKIDNFAEKKTGVFSFNFKTIKMPFDVNYARIAINVQEGFFLEGGQAEVDYQPNVLSFKAIEESARDSAGGVQSQALYDFSSQIQWQPGYVKETQGLDPLESFNVEGRYAKSKFFLYQSSIYISIIVLAALIFTGVMITRRVAAKSKKMNFMMKSVTSGIISGASVVILWVIISILMRYVSASLPYTIQPMFNILVLVITAIIMLTVIFGPAVYMGNKYGLPAGLITIGSAVITMLIVGIIVLLLYGMISPNQPPILYRGGGVVAESIGYAVK